MKKIGQFTVYQKYYHLTCFLGYQAPKQPNFFEFAILNALSCFPDRKSSMHYVLNDVMRVGNLYLYEQAMKDLIEKYKIVSLLVQHSKLNQDYNNWLAYSLENYEIDKSTKISNDGGYLIMRDEIREQKTDIYYDGLNNVIDVQSQSSKQGLNALPKGAFLVENNVSLFCSATSLLAYCTKNKVLINRNFTDQTIFKYVRFDSEKLDDATELDNYFVKRYVPLEVLVWLDENGIMHLTCPESSAMENWINLNNKAAEEMKKWYLEMMNGNIAELCSNSSRELPLKKLDYRQDSEFVINNLQPTITAPYCLIINNDLIDANTALDSNWGDCESIEFFVVVNVQNEETHNLTGNKKPVFAISDETMLFDSDFVACYLNANREVQPFVMKKIKIISNAPPLECGFVCSHKASVDFLFELLSKIQKWYDNMIAHIVANPISYDYRQMTEAIYLCYKMTGSKEHFDHLLITLDELKIKDKILIYLKAWQELKQLKSNGEWAAAVFERLIDTVQHNIKPSEQIIDCYANLENYHIFNDTIILKILTMNFPAPSVELNHIFALSKKVKEGILGKIWNQNTFNCVEKTLIGLINQSTKEAIERYGYLDHYPKNMLLMHLMNFIKYFLEQQSALANRRFDIVQRHLEEWWINITMLNEILNGMQDSQMLILHVWQDYSYLEIQFCQQKFGEMRYNENGFEDYCNKCEFSKAWYLLLHDICDQIDMLLKQINSYQMEYVNEKLFVLNLYCPDRELYKRIETLYKYVRHNAFFDDWRNEQNSNKNRELLREYYKKVKEMLN